MVKKRYVVAFIIVIILLLSASVITYHKNYVDNINEYKEALSDLSKSLKNQYDALFFQICESVENTIIALEKEGIEASVLQEKTGESMFINHMMVVTENGDSVNGDSSKFAAADLHNYFNTTSSVLCAGMLKAEDGSLYVVNQLSSSEVDYLLLIDLDYSYINQLIQPNTYNIFSSYPYLISHDGYMVYHKKDKLIGMNVIEEKEQLMKYAQLSEDDYEYMVSVIGKDRRIFYKAYGVDKIAYSRNLKAFNGNVVLTANYAEMKHQQYMATFRIVLPMILFFFVATYIFLKYLYIMKYTDYFTEVKNNMALRKYYLKNNSGKDKMLVFRIDNVISSSGDYSMNNDMVFYKISDYFKSFSPTYIELYRISRIHYVFVYKGNSDAPFDMVTNIKQNLLSGSESLFLRGKILLLDLNVKGPLTDIDSHLINNMNDYYEDLNIKKRRSFNKYSELLENFSENNRKKAIVEKLIMGNEIEPFFHPIVNIATGHTEHYEVLLRPTTTKELSPYEIITIAEENGWVESLDKSMIKQAFYFANRILVEKGRRISLSINLSCMSVNNGVVEYLCRTASLCDIKKKDIIIEITETAAFDNLEESIQNLLYLKSQGFKLAIDDFGTGYAQVELLSKLDVEYVKIDGVFIKDVEKDAQKIKTLNALVYLAKNYNTLLIAEYVEGPAVLKILERLEIDMAQGYYFDKPLDMITLASRQVL